jgi:hypothetical protein
MRIVFIKVVIKARVAQLSHRVDPGTAADPSSLLPCILGKVKASVLKIKNKKGGMVKEREVVCIVDPRIAKSHQTEASDIRLCFLDFFSVFSAI